MRIDLYGREIEAVKHDAGWKVFHVGTDGTRRPATDVVVPSWVSEGELVEYLDDLFHEHATPDHPRVLALD